MERDGSPMHYGLPSGTRIGLFGQAWIFSPFNIPFTGKGVPGPAAM